MRKEDEMYDLILRIGNNDSRIRAIYMNGSRTNPTAKKDIFQDYDVVYVVNETKPFITNDDWIKSFGDILYMQYPDGKPNKDNENSEFYGWLMQFTDGNRIDLHVESVNHALESIHDDSLCKILLDKDRMFTIINESTLKKWYVKMPSYIDFNKCCTEFWWCTNNVCKGLWREEITYVLDMVNFVVRKELERLLGWKAQADSPFAIAVGKSSKYLHKYISKSDYEGYLGTYFDADISKAWEKLYLMCDLFEEVERYVANKLNFSINQEEINGARIFINQVRHLPKDATDIF